MYDLLIRRGKLVTAERSFQADIAIQGGKIADIAQDIDPTLAKEVIDAGGQMVLPGLIDPHVHIKQRFGDGFAADDFYTATVSAAFGGITTVLDFAIQWDKAYDLQQTVQMRLAQFARDSVVDYGVHACPTISSQATIDAMPNVVASNVPSFKVYMTYSRQNRMADDGVIYNMLRQSVPLGAWVGVHAENDALTRFNEEACIQRGETSPHYFPIAKGNLVEAEAVHRALYLNEAAGGNLYIFHLSTREGLQMLRASQAAGHHVAAETCTHYLALNSSVYDRPDGANFICSPPIRSKEDQQALWEGVADGSISVVSSDHCGYSTAHKAAGNGNFIKTPNGLPAMELRLPVLYTYGVREGRISMEKLVAVTSTNPAKLFGMYPQKGALSVGSDADIVLFDPDKSRTVSASILHSPVDWSPFDGMRLYGFATMTLSHGETLIDHGMLCGERGRGRFVPRRRVQTQ